jgi:hypothetical protein
MRPFRLSPESGKSARIPYQYQSKPRFQRSNSNQNPKDSTLTRCYLPSPVGGRLPQRVRTRNADAVPRIRGSTSISAPDALRRVCLVR